MVTVPVGIGAYKRTYSGEPEIRLENRFVEKNPANLREHTSLLSRAGTDLLAAFDSGAYAPATKNRRNFSKVGLFGGDLFVVNGPNLWRYAADGTKTQISGIVNGTGFPTYAWMKGIGYEYLFIADGLLLQFYQGGSHASGVLTASGSITNQVVSVGGVFYSWDAAVDTNAPDGSSAHPWLANPGSDPLQALANLINFDGVRGVDFSTALGGPATAYQAAVAGGPPATSMTITATSEYADGNAITTTVFSGASLAWSHATLTGGGTHVLQGVSVPPLALSDNSGGTSNSAKALASVSGFVLVSIGNSAGFYFILPGEVTIDPLNFAEKESNPDNISDMLTIGDNVVIAGDGSTENWYATGDITAPFAPIEGRVYKRGAIAGTLIAVKDDAFLVGDDGIVYSIGYASGDTSSYGVNRVSNHGVEERIRILLRQEQGL